MKAPEITPKQCRKAAFQEAQRPAKIRSRRNSRALSKGSARKNHSDQTLAATLTMDAMFQHMKAEAESAAAESEKKDALIVNLQQTIAGLQEEIKALRQSVSVLTNAKTQSQ